MMLEDSLWNTNTFGIQASTLSRLISVVVQTRQVPSCSWTSLLKLSIEPAVIPNGCPIEDRHELAALFYATKSFSQLLTSCKTSVRLLSSSFWIHRHYKRNDKAMM